MEQQNDFSWNPGNSNNNVTGVAKNALAAFEGINVVVDIIKLPLTLLVFSILAAMAKVSVNLSCLIVLLSVGSSAYFSFRAYRQLKELKADDERSFAQVPIIMQRYKALQKTSSLPGLLLFIYLVIKILLSQSNFPLTNAFDQIILYGALILSLISIINEWYRASAYAKISQQNLSKAQVLQATNIIDKKILLGYSLLLLPVFYGVIYLAWTQSRAATDNLHLILLIIAFAVTLFPLLVYVTLRRVSSLQLQDEPANPLPVVTVPEQASQAAPAPLQPQNNILGALYGVVNNSSALQGYSVLGAGKVFHPENTLLFTPQGILLWKVPVFGAGKIMDNENFQTDNFVWNRSEIKQKAEEMLGQYTVDQILSSDPDNKLVAYDTLSSLLLFEHGIINVPRLELITKTGEKSSYLFIDRSPIPQLKESLSTILGQVFSVK